jgi:hypothetical protein
MVWINFTEVAQEIFYVRRGIADAQEKQQQYRR